MNRILVVDDDAHIRELVSTVLRGEGYAVAEAGDGKEAMEMADEERFDLCVLDIMMPEADGYTVCSHLRRYQPELAVLMLTAKAEMSQKVKGFELGADDYLTKPFAAEELKVRVRALLRRVGVAAAKTVKAGTVLVDKARSAVVCDGQVLDIPMKEFELLYLLASFPGRTLARDRLLEEVWGYDFDGNERTLDVHIGRLRERFPSHGFAIVTVRGLGYRLEVGS